METGLAQNVTENCYLYYTRWQRGASETLENQQTKDVTFCGLFLFVNISVANDDDNLRCG
jgi:hypothetical protein